MTAESQLMHRKPGNAGVARLLAASAHSMRGLRQCWRHEAAFRQEVVVALPLLAVAVFGHVERVERALLIASVLLVLIVEVLNSGIEAVVDRIGPERHPLSGMAKDLGSAAVTLSLVLAASVWGCILL